VARPAALDPRTPIVVGVGESSERIGEPTYEARSPVALAARAAHAACDDAASVEVLAPAIDTVVGIRQFEISAPWAKAPFGRSDNMPRSVALRIGANPRRAVLEHRGGQAPQQAVNAWAQAIAQGRAEVVLIAGAEAISTIRHLLANGDPPDWSESVGGALEDRGYGPPGTTDYERRHQLHAALPSYALLEHARRARLGWTRDDYRQAMAQLFAPFTTVAAANPHAAAPTKRSANDLAEITERNRLVADPYPRLVVSRDQVNQGAAVVLCSVDAAERLGIAREKWVFLHGHADVEERSRLERADLGASPASVLASRRAIDRAGIGVDDIAAFDLYSCFPIAVFNQCDGLGLAPEDPRRLTVTGGLPYFGGPGNNYSTHAIAAMVRRLRADAGAYGFVGANGGIMYEYSAGVYSTTPRRWQPSDSRALQAEVEAWPVPCAIAYEADGHATIESYTVLYGDERPVGIIVGRLIGNGARFVALTDDEGDETAEELADGDEPVGRRVIVRASEAGNRFTLVSQLARGGLPSPPIVPGGRRRV
jgi:acetyl-CoA C-acetyltransferase